MIRSESIIFFFILFYACFCASALSSDNTLEIINKYACKYGVDPDLAANLAYAESTMDPYSRGSMGERGLFQISPGTWDWLSGKVFGKKMPFYMAFDPETNTEMAAWYLSWIEDRLGDNSSQAAVLCAYNMGLSKLQRMNFKVPASHKNNIYNHYFQKLSQNLPDRDDHSSAGQYTMLSQSGETEIID